MNKIAIITDSNSGITQEQADKLGVFIIPMPVVVGEEIYYEGVNIGRNQFYEKLSQDINISTSQPSIWSDRVAEEPGKFTTVDERNEE